MLGLPRFRYTSPGTLEEASRIVARSQGAVFVSGGTDLYPNMKRRQTEPGVLVSLRGIAELEGGIRGDGRIGLTVGANTTLSEIVASPVVALWYPAFAQSAASVGGPQIRNSGTLGGNLCQDTRCTYYDMPSIWREAAGFCLKKGGEKCRVAPGSSRCWAVVSSDVAPAAIVLGGRLRLAGAKGERVIEAKSLYKNDGASHLAKARDEVIVQLFLPPVRGLRATYLKLRQRGTIDFGVLGVAAALRLKGGVCTHSRVVIGGVGPSPLEAEGAEEVLVGNRVTDRTIEKASEAAAECARPLDNAALPPLYRRSMVQVCVARALRVLVKS